MDDLISRRAALKELIYAVKNAGVLDANDIRTVFKALPTAQPEPQWIPCSERMPEEDVEVLIAYRYKGGEGDTSHTCIGITTYGHMHYGGIKVVDCKHWREPFEYFESNYEVIAWMPLPEPYKPNNK